MPIYEYRCDNCGHEFESIQKVSDAPLTTCPACAQDSLRKKVSAAGFRLKGGGWYETDFKSGNKKNVIGGAAGGDGAAGSGENAGKSGESAGSKTNGGGTSGGGESRDAGKTAGADSKSGGATKASSE